MRLFNATSLTLMTALAVQSFSGSIAHASDESAKALMEKARAAFAMRGTSGNAAEALSLAEKAGKEAESDDLKYDALIMQSRSYYWMGGHGEGGDSKENTYNKGVNAAVAATKLNPDYAEGHYFNAINLGRWAEAYGIVKAIVIKGAHRWMMTALEKCYDAKSFYEVDADGEPLAGDMIDGSGPRRAYGRLWQKLPGVYGGSRSKALGEYETAVTNGPQVALNTVYYAEALYNGGGAAEQSKAKELLDALIATVSKDPAGFNPARAPETADELVEAKSLRHSMGN